MTHIIPYFIKYRTYYTYIHFLIEMINLNYISFCDFFYCISYTKYKNIEMSMKAIVKQFNGEESSYLSTNFLKESDPL